MGTWILIVFLLGLLIFFLMKWIQERRRRTMLEDKLANLEVGMHALQDAKTKIDKTVFHQSLNQKELRLSRALISLDHSLTLAAELAKKSLRAQTCLVFFMDARRVPPALVLKTVSSDVPHLQRQLAISSGDGLLGLALKEQKAIHYPNLTEAMALMLPYYTKAMNVAALFAAPIHGKQGWEGLLVIDRMTAGPLSPDEHQVMNLLCRQIAVTLIDARVQERSQDQAQELLALYEASKALSAPLSVASTVETVLRVATQTVRCDSCLLALVSDRRLIIEGAIGYDPSQFPPGHELPQEGLFQWVVREGKPVLFQGQTGSASLPAYMTEGIKFPARSFMIVPLTLENRVMGLLKCDSAQPEYFTEYDREIFGILANQASLALERAQRYEEERERATTDGLTGLSNHRHFQDQVAKLVDRAQHHQTPLTLILCDVDHFKAINDTHGHLQGDAVLKQLGLILLKCCRTDTLIARYGGEEFAVLLPEVDSETGRKVAERIRQRVEQELKVSVNGLATSVTVSLGVATLPQDAGDSRALFQTADRALYRAKADGRNLVR